MPADGQEPTYVWGPRLRQPKHSAYVRAEGDQWIAYCIAVCSTEFKPHADSGAAFLDSLNHRGK